MEIVIALVIALVIVAVVFRKAVKSLAYSAEKTAIMFSVEQDKDLNKRAKKLAEYAKRNKIIDVDDLSTLFSQGNVKVSKKVKKAREQSATAEPVANEG